MQQRSCKTSTNQCLLFHGAAVNRREQAENPACGRPASMSCVPPQALCHSARAGYTLCLFVIPSDSAGARGQTCNPERSLPKQALRTQKPQPRFCLSLFLPTLPSLFSPLPLSLSLSLFISHCALLLPLWNDPRFNLSLSTGQFSDHFPPLLFINNTVSHSSLWCP